MIPTRLDMLLLHVVSERTSWAQNMVPVLTAGQDML